MVDSSHPKRRFRIFSRAAAKRLGVLAIAFLLLLIWMYWSMLRMPGHSFAGDIPPMTDAQHDLARELGDSVQLLAGEIGARNVFHEANLHRAANELDRMLTSYGYDVDRQTFSVRRVSCANLIAERNGGARADEIVVIGAHYDSCEDTPGADDNASGCAGVLALARQFADQSPQRTLRFALFVNEEPPFFMQDDMGSLRYAQRCKERDENVVAMISLEMLGYYRDEPGSQQYPISALSHFYPDRGNFIAFVGNFGSRGLVRESIGAFRSKASFPSEGAALPGWIEGIGWSDHWAFWQAGYPGLMVTDTAMFRSPHYHQPTDEPDRIDYDRMARVVDGLTEVVRHLASPP